MVLIVHNFTSQPVRYPTKKVQPITPLSSRLAYYITSTWVLLHPTMQKGVARIFQRGGHTVSKWGYSPDCHYGQDIVMVFSPPVVGCLLKKGLQKGGSRTPQDPPWLRPCGVQWEEKGIDMPQSLCLVLLIRLTLKTQHSALDNKPLLTYIC